MKLIPTTKYCTAHFQYHAFKGYYYRNSYDEESDRVSIKQCIFKSSGELQDFWKEMTKYAKPRIQQEYSTNIWDSESCR